VPAGVRRFIGAEIQSVEQLEVLLLLRAAPDKGWTAKEVARALVSRPESAASWLSQMRERELLSEEDGVYTYAPSSPEVATTVDELAESYSRYRVAVIGLIFSKPSERVTLFSDAFRVRRPKD
jgi:predicted transcriptional regulator